MSEPMSRREFVRVASTALGTTAVLATVPGCTSGPRQTTGVATPTSSFGADDAMSKRILVGYATRTGSTVEVAEKIGLVLGERGFSVEVKPMKERPSLQGYDGVVLGSAVNGGAWLPEAVQFVEGNRGSLSSVPVALFCVHIMNLDDTDKARARRLAYLKNVRSTVAPIDEAYFAGVGPTAAETSLIARWAFRAFGGGGEGDCRDWDAISAWAQQLPLPGGAAQ